MSQCERTLKVKILPFTSYLLSMIMSYTLGYALWTEGFLQLRIFFFLDLFVILLFLKYFIDFPQLFIYFWLHWVFVAARGPSPVAVSGGYPSLRCAGLSLRWPLPLQSMGSRRVDLGSRGTWAQQLRLAGPERRLSSCDSRAQLLCGMWDPPGPGLKPTSPALAGGSSSTAPPGKSLRLRI